MPGNNIQDILFVFRFMRTHLESYRIIDLKVVVVFNSLHTAGFTIPFLIDDFPVSI